MEEKFKEIKGIFLKNQRYFWAALILISAFVINKSFPAEIITSEECAGGNCKAVLENPDLTDKNSVFYANNVFSSNDNEYYRLIFQVRANDNSKITVKVSNSIDEEREIAEIDLKKSKDEISHEAIFSTDKQYTDVLFKKESQKEGEEISISGVQVSKLNVSDEKELSGLAPTIKGDLRYDSDDQGQKENSHTFDQLKEQNVILGQIFKPREEYIASVTLDLDIIKQDNNGGKKYKFELREAEFESNVPEITSHVLASTDFTSESIERFRQDDGKFNFPVFAKLDTEKYYFIGINNNNVAVDKFNYLRLKGTNDFGKYTDGMVAVKTKGKTYSAIGNLYFIIHELSFSEYQGKKILGGEIIEDIGKGQGKFTYRTRGGLYDLSDLFLLTSDVGYDDGKKALFGEMEEGEESAMVYKFDTIFPYERIKIIGEQAGNNWGKAAIHYSFDGNNWTEIPPITDNSTEVSIVETFNYSFSAPGKKQSEIYVKIAPREFKDKEKYGIKKFKVEADLLMDSGAK